MLESVTLDLEEEYHRQLALDKTINRLEYAGRELDKLIAGMQARTIKESEVPDGN